MTSVLLVAAIGLLWYLATVHRGLVGFASLSPAGALALAFVAFEVLVVVITEGTSLGHHFTARRVGVAWTVVLLALLVATALTSRRARERGETLVAVRDWAARARRVDVGTRLWIVAIVAVFAILAVIGWVYPPNNVDSMVYHLARVEHWIQERSVADYATHYLAQIELSPLHEYNMAHLHLLADTDRLDGFVQLFGALVCVVSAGEIARLLGGSRWVQTAAMVVCATIPGGILLATSTENNYFAAAVGAALVLMLVSWTAGRGWIQRAVAVGATAGLAVLTKGTLPVLVGPAAVALAILAVRGEWRTVDAASAMRRALAMAALAAVAATVVSGPYLRRNIALFGGVTGPVSQSTISSSIGVRPAIANVLRSSAADFMIGDGSGGIETAVSRATLGGLGALFDHLDVAPTDQRYMLGNDANAFGVQDYTLRTRLEDYGANPWHVLLIAIALAFLVVAVARGARQLRRPLLLACMLTLGFVVFTATARWSVYAVRYQIPLLVLWSPIVAIVLGRAHRVIGHAVLVLLLAACLPQLLDNAGRSLLHPELGFTSELQAYFPDYHENPVGPTVALENYSALTAAVSQTSCTAVGLADWIVFEYPIWVGLRSDGWHGTLEAVGVTNASRRLEQSEFRPCARIWQVDPGFAFPDDGNVDLVFGNLALSVEPAHAAGISASAAHFSSDVAGVRLLPGGGWSYGGDGRPVLHGSGSLVVESDTQRTIDVALREPAGAMRSVAGSLGGATAPATATSDGVAFRLTVPAGVSRVRLTLLGGAAADAGAATLPLDGVAVVPVP